MVAVTRHHEDEIIREADESPVPEAVVSAATPLVLVSHLLMPLLVEMIVQFRQGDVGEQRGKDPALRSPS
jgi:hypothetical protein